MTDQQPGPSLGRTLRTPTATHWGAYEAVVRDGRVIALEPMPGDPDPSSIANGMASALYDRSRITEPMIRRGWLEHGPGRAARGREEEPFYAVPWERALDLAAAEIERIRRTYGNEAIYGGSYGWGSAGRFHHPQSQLHRFLAQAGGYTASQGSYSVAAMEVILPRVIGGHKWSAWERGPTWADIAHHGQLVVSFGGLADKNSEVNPGGIGRHEVPSWQRLCRERGVRFVNISPVRADAAPWLAADWIPLRPNTDVALMLALAYVIVAEGRHDRDFLERCCVGFERFAAYLHGAEDGIAKTPGWGGAIAGVEESTIIELAHLIVGRRTTINVSWSLQRQDHGEQSYWTAVTLAALAGSIGRRGGGFAAGLGIANTGVRPERQRVAALPQGPNPVRTAIPVSRIADMLLHPGRSYEFNGAVRSYPDIRLVYWAGGNPFHHHQDLNRLARAWQRPETVIVHDSWWNALARRADIVFPVSTTLERNDYAVGANDRTITAIKRAVAPPVAVRSDYEVFAALATRLGFRRSFTEDRSAEDWVRLLYERTRAARQEDAASMPSFDEFWELGQIEIPATAHVRRLSFKRLRHDPAGHPLDTPSGRIEIFSATIAAYGYDDCPGHPTWLEPREWIGGPAAERFPLHLISNQPQARLHSQYDNGSFSRSQKVAGREPVWIHPEDAHERGIAHGDVVRVFNERGACLAGAKLTDGVRRGVIVLSTGAWYDPVEPGGLDRHGNPNVLTPDRGTSRLGQGPTPGSTLVEVERFTGTPPRVMAFEPPPVLRETARAPT
jgi:biotin/methionine sulfoxide reductase